MVTLEVINEVSSEWEITSEVRRLVVTKALKSNIGTEVKSEFLYRLNHNKDNMYTEYSTCIVQFTAKRKEQINTQTLQ